MSNQVAVKIPVEDIQPGDCVFLNKKGNALLKAAGYKLYGAEIGKFSVTYGTVSRKSSFEDRWDVDMAFSGTKGGVFSEKDYPGMYYMDISEVGNAYRLIDVYEEPEVVEEVEDVISQGNAIHEAIDLLTDNGFKVIFEMN